MDMSAPALPSDIEWHQLDSKQSSLYVQKTRNSSQSSKMMLVALMRSSALQAAHSAKETSFFATTESTYSPSTPDQLERVFAWCSLVKMCRIMSGKDRKIFAEWILSAPQETILSVTSVSVPELEPAKIRDSVPCTICDETVMESRLRNMDGKAVCIPCFEKHQSIKQSATRDG